MGVERTLTFVGGGSAKFWEVRQDGAELHIRFGRLGAAGQTQVKSLGSAPAASPRPSRRSRQRAPRTARRPTKPGSPSTYASRWPWT